MCVCVCVCVCARACSGLQSAFRESIGSVRVFRARFASQLVRFGSSERVSRVNWFSSGLQSAFRESIGSVRVFRARFASQLVQFGSSERRAHVCVCIYIVYEISKGSNMFTKTCFKIYLALYVFQSKKIN